MHIELLTRRRQTTKINIQGINCNEGQFIKNYSMTNNIVIVIIIEIITIIVIIILIQLSSFSLFNIAMLAIALAMTS